MTSAWRAVAAPAVVASTLLIAATTAEAQSSPPTITLCCDSSKGTCTTPGTGSGSGPMSAQTPCPDPGPSGVMITIPNVTKSVCGGGTCSATVTTYTSEPPAGFVGVCLAPSLSYQTQLPNVCYSVAIAGEPNHGYTVVSALTAGKVAGVPVFVPYSTLNTSPARARPDSYQTLLACYPHNVHGHCPCQTRPISRSCCELGGHLTSLDGMVARGYSTMPGESAQAQAPCSCLNPQPDDSQFRPNTSCPDAK